MCLINAITCMDIITLVTCFLMFVKVTLKGPIDEKTGMVMNIKDLKLIIHNRILVKVDHHNLDQVDYFKSVPSTAENIVVWCWDQLMKDLKGLLYELELKETDKNSVVYRGEEINF